MDLKQIESRYVKEEGGSTETSQPQTEPLFGNSLRVIVHVDKVESITGEKLMIINETRSHKRRRYHNSSGTVYVVFYFSSFPVYRPNSLSF